MVAKLEITFIAVATGVFTQCMTTLLAIALFKKPVKKLYLNNLAKNQKRLQI